MLRARRSRRQGVAAVEMAVLAIPLFVLLAGVWEVGRMVQAQQITVNAAREGARLAALGFNINTFGNYTYIYTDSQKSSVQTGTIPQYVDVAVKNYLIGAGIKNVNNVAVEFQFLKGDLASPSSLTPDNSRTEPYQGIKGEGFLLRVRVPYDNFRWTPVTLINPSEIVATVRWTMMMNEPFTVKDTVPGWNGVE
jgi:hypothetical protein